MNAMKKKIKSDRGASISFALLLFLVCAVISSIVIVAGTTASGRMSEIAKMDQRYYSVTSAARLLCEMDKSNTVIQVTTEATQSEDEYGKTGEPLEVVNEGFPKTEYYTEHYIEGTSDTPTTEPGLFEYAASVLLTKTLSESEADYFKDKEFSLEVTGSEAEKRDYLTVDITAALNKAGKLILDLHNHKYEEGTYSLRLFFSSAVNEKETSSQVNGKIHTTIEKTKISWVLDSLETKDASGEAAG